jgi:hypothetical protein
MSYTTLRRVYAFSDTYGRSKNPFLQDDADALVSTDFRSFPLEPVRREFDIYGREAITGHMLRLIFTLHDDIKDYKYLSPAVQKEFAETTTGIFINAAPRTDTQQNGAPFYVATAPNMRIVTTDLTALSTVKHRIETLSVLNNLKNSIYSNTEQFRSSYTAFLLHPDHGHELEKQDLNIIPDYPDDKWELSYVDRFGNLITYTNKPDDRWKEVQEAAKKENGKVNLLIGNVGQYVQTGVSLKDADPGALTLYQNGDLDVVRKWEKDEDSYARLYKSAFFQFSKPLIGARIRIVD